MRAPVQPATLRPSVAAICLLLGLACVPSAARADALPPNTCSPPGSACSYRGKPGRCVARSVKDHRRGKTYTNNVCDTDPLIDDDSEAEGLTRRQRATLLGLTSFIVILAAAVGGALWRRSRTKRAS